MTQGSRLNASYAHHIAWPRFPAAAAGSTPVENTIRDSVLQRGDRSAAATISGLFVEERDLMQKAAKPWMVERQGEGEAGIRLGAMDDRAATGRHPCRQSKAEALHPHGITRTSKHQ